MIARRLTRLVKAFPSGKIKTVGRELQALKSIAKTVNEFSQCPYCGAHREKGWTEKHRQGCKLWKQLLVVLE